MNEQELISKENEGQNLAVLLEQHKSEMETLKKKVLDRQTLISNAYIKTPLDLGKDRLNKKKEALEKLVREDEEMIREEQKAIKRRNAIETMMYEKERESFSFDKRKEEQFVILVDPIHATIGNRKKTTINTGFIQMKMTKLESHQERIERCSERYREEMIGRCNASLENSKFLRDFFKADDDILREMGLQRYWIWKLNYCLNHPIRYQIKQTLYSLNWRMEEVFEDC